MNRTALSVLVIAVLTGPAAAGEVGFLEDFSLTEDRTVPLKQLIPGTEDYYYYHCIHFQNTKQFGKVGPMLALWIKRHGHTARVEEIRNRQALLTYAKNSKQSLEHIRQKLGLRFDHQRERLNKQLDLPTQLGPERISRATLTKKAFARHSNLRGFEDAALDWLTTQNLKTDRRRDLLRRMRRPTTEHLVRLVVDDLKYKHSRGFGSHPVHAQMLQSQLDECLGRLPKLLNETKFVQIYLSKLQPNPDTDWRHDVKVREAYLDRLWAFVKRLAPVHNSLKAHVLYSRLLHDRGLGTYDKARFMTYLQLPRNAGYVPRKYLARIEHRNVAANLRADYRKQTLMPPVSNDEPLVRSYLAHFFLKEHAYEPYAVYVRDTLLKPLFAETMIVNGMGDMERWYSMLSPAAYKALKERVDLDFAYTSKTVFGVDEPVTLDLLVKNVKSLIVKVYQINALNYYRQTGREVNTDINLDGLVANNEKAHPYKDAALRRAKRTFKFPELTKPGVYIVEFIGNGKSSRALVRKGRLHFLTRTSTAGVVFTVLDSKLKKLSDAKLWIAGHEYTPAKDGTIAVPFSTKPGSQPVILVHGEFASLDRFNHPAEQYALAAGIHVEREALVKRKKATVVVRPQLYLNGMPVTLSILKEAKLVITSVDREGISATKPVVGFKLLEDRESTYEFQVPENLATIRFQLTAKVRSLSRDKDVTLATGAQFAVNAIDKTDKIELLHLSRIDGRYVADLLGKNGEPLPGRPVHVTLKHRFFREPVHATLQTDGQGRVRLHHLQEIDWVRAKGPQGTEQTWHLVQDQRRYPSVVHGMAGKKEQVLIPYMGKEPKATPAAFSLLETRGGTFVANRLEFATLVPGFLQIRGLPAGDYDLLLKESHTRIRIRIAAGKRTEPDYVVSQPRTLEVRNPRPLQIVTVVAGDKQVRVQLANATPFARVHVFATRYMPAWSTYRNLGAIAFPDPVWVGLSVPTSRYVAGRDIGEEYRYIIERKYAIKFPGNMLTRPALLLNPWAVRDTQTGKQDAKAGEHWRRSATSPTTKRPERGKDRIGSIGGQDFANLDFLSEPAIVLLNLQADKKGIVTVPREVLAGHNQLHVMAVDPQNTVYREVSLPEVKLARRDLRLRKGLDPKGHFTEQKQIAIVAEGKPFVLRDVQTGRFEAFDSLAGVYRLYATLSGNATLREFRFILDWPKLDRKAKRAKYSKYACHELNFFLLKKDPAFFKEVVQPYLRNKKDKTFLDRWLVAKPADDLSGFTKPWAFGQLNIVERILLARHIKGQRTHVSRHVQDLFDLVPPDVERFNRLFKTALAGSALEAGDRFGVADKLEEMGQDMADDEDGGGAAGPGTGGGKRPTGGTAALAPAAPPMAKPESRAQLARKLKNQLDAPADAKKAKGYYARDRANRESLRRLYRKLDKTKEWAENNYYHLTIAQQNAGLVTVNAFWRDYAAHPGKGPFFSEHVAEAARNFPEMMFALAVLDLPFEAGEHQTAFEGAQLTLKAGSPLVVFHQQVRAAADAEQKVPVLVSQNFFRHGDRYRHVGNERTDKFVTEEFLAHVVYGCQVVVTNPTSSRQKLDVLVQIPRGALPVMKGQVTRGSHVDLQPYRTQTLEYYFYFPRPGRFEHYPVHVAKQEKRIASAEPFSFNVVEELTKIDRTSWDYVSQHGSEGDVVKFLQTHNINRLKLERIAWRMGDAKFFQRVAGILADRKVYNHTLWSYAVKNEVAPAIREYLQHADGFVRQCGATIDSPLLVIDPVVRKAYEHLEYSPLVNARAHRLGKTRKILNDRFFAQYMRLVKVLSYRPKLDDADLMAVTYYLLLQDRVEEALTFFKRVNPKNLATRLQHDYFAAYLDFFNTGGELAKARAIVGKYADHPVDRWRKLFANVASQIAELDGKAAPLADAENRDQAQGRLAATEPSLEFVVEARQVRLDYQNITACRVNYYLMDIELLFSRNPFVKTVSGQFSYIRPNRSDPIRLDRKKRSHTFPLPEAFHSANVLVEIEAAGIKKSQPYFANSLAVQVIETYGQVRVTHADGGQPLSKVYVKVYARMKDGRVRFYKDGYTDLRGRFDFTSLNTNELDFVERFALLILSEKHGAIVREAAPPKR